MLKYHRKFVLNKYVKYYDLSTGFGSVRYWRTRIEKNVFLLHEKIHDDLDFFDFEYCVKNVVICHCFQFVCIF